MTGVCSGSGTRISARYRAASLRAAVLLSPRRLASGEINQTLHDANKMLGIFGTEIGEHLVNHLLMQLATACAEGTAILGKMHRDRTAIALVALTRDKALLLKRFQGLGHSARGCLSAFGDVTGPDLPPLAFKAGNRHNRVHLRRRDALGRRRLLTLLSHSSCGIEQTAAQSSCGIVHANLLSILNCLAA